MADKSERYVDLPVEVAGLVVGKKGKTIISIKNRSKAQVELAPDPLPSDERLKRLTIKGSATEALKAEELVIDLLAKWCTGDEEKTNLELMPNPLRNKVLEYKAAHPNLTHQPANPSAPQPQGGSAAQPQGGSAPQPQGLGFRPAEEKKGSDSEVKVELEIHKTAMAWMSSNNGERILSIEHLTGAKFNYAGSQPENVQMTRIQFSGAEQAVAQARSMFVYEVNRKNMQMIEQQQHHMQAAYEQNFNLQTGSQISQQQALGVSGQTGQTDMYGQTLTMSAQGLAAMSNMFVSQQGLTPHQQPLPFQMQQAAGITGANGLQATQHLASSVQIPLSTQQYQQGLGLPQDYAGLVAGQRLTAEQQKQYVAQQQQVDAQQAQLQAQQAAQQAQQAQQAQAAQGHTAGGSVSQHSAASAASAPQPPHPEANGEAGGAEGLRVEPLGLRVELRVPAGAGGMIVGKKAAQIKKFRQDCGAKVSVKPDPPTGEPGIKIVVIEGTTQSLHKAVLMLSETLAIWATNDHTCSQDQHEKEYWTEYLTSQKLTTTNAAPVRPSAPLAPENEARKEMPGANIDDSAVVRLEMKIPVAAAGLVVGKQGKTIKAVKARTGANVALSPDPVADDPSKKIISVQGQKSQVKQARDAVLDIMLGWFRNSEDGGGPTSGLPQLQALVQENISMVKTRDANASGAPSGSEPKQVPKIQADLTLVGGEVTAGQGSPRRVEFHVTIAAAAMIIGKKGIMLKLLQTKSNAKISLDQLAQADGRKRVVIEGTGKEVQIAQHQIHDILIQCDESKYEEAAKKKAAEEEAKRKAEESQRKREVDSRPAQSSARSAAQEEERKEAERKAEEQKVLEKRAKVAAKQEEERKLAAKVKENPFAFLIGDDDDEEEEEEEEKDAKSPGKSSGSKNRRKKKGTAEKSGTSPPKPSEAPAPARAKEEFVDAKEEDDDEEDSSEDDGEEQIGLDRLLHSLHAELEPEEKNMQFTGSPIRATEGANSGGGNSGGLLKLHVGSSSRRGVSHANEDRSHIGEFTELLSNSTQEALLTGARSRSIPFFAVIDGHGGAGASELISQRLHIHIANALESRVSQSGGSGPEACAQIPSAMEDGFAAMEAECEELSKTKGDHSGACVTCALIVECNGQHSLHVANLGDCRAVVARKDGAKFSPIRLTKDHRSTTPSERSRIEAAGGKVIEKRAMGDLIPSRTLGDHKTKNKCPGAISAVPELSAHTLTPDDASLVLASDGLWDDMKLDRVMGYLQKYRTPDTAVKEISKAVVKKYGAKNSKPADDLTVVAINFEWP